MGQLAESCTLTYRREKATCGLTALTSSSLSRRALASSVGDDSLTGPVVAGRLDETAASTRDDSALA